MLSKMQFDEIVCVLFRCKQPIGKKCLYSTNYLHCVTEDWPPLAYKDVSSVQFEKTHFEVYFMHTKGM